MHDLENLRKFSDSFNLQDQMFKRYSKCVYCGSKTFKKLKIQSFRENFYTKAIIHDLNISKNILLKMKVYQCQKCFIIQNNPWFDNDHTWRIYSNIWTA